MTPQPNTRIEAVHTAEALAQVHAIRVRVFVEEQQVPAELEYEYETESQHFLLYYNAIPAATARWRYSKPGHVKVERIAVLLEYRGLGLGHQVVRHLLAQLPPGYQRVYMHAQQYAQPFYEQLGFRAVGQPFDEAGIQHIEMEWAV